MGQSADDFTEIWQVRARSIKPALFKNELLGRADPLITILFEGLWCSADREGRLEERPDRLRADILPYRDGVDLGAMLGWLQKHDFIDRYKVRGIAIISVKTFSDHQNPHHRELPSKLPERPSKNPGRARGQPRASPSLAPVSPQSSRADSGLRTPDSLNLTPDSGLPLRGPPPSAPGSREPKPRTVLKNGGEEPRAGSAPKPVNDIIAGMRQRFQRP